MAIFFHWLYTYVAQIMASGVTRSGVYNWLEYVPYIVFAIIILVLWKPKAPLSTASVAGSSSVSDSTKKFPQTSKSLNK